MKYLSILLSVLLGAVISVPADTFELPLHPGWNQVSVPFDVDADALASLAQSQLLGKVITYGTDGFEAVDKLIAGQGYWMFDLSGYIVDRLKATGVDASCVQRCTYAEQDNFYSYRRTTHQREPDYGRQLSAIVLK